MDVKFYPNPNKPGKYVVEVNVGGEIFELETDKSSLSEAEIVMLTAVYAKSKNKKRQLTLRDTSTGQVETFTVEGDEYV